MSKKYLYDYDRLSGSLSGSMYPNSRTLEGYPFSYLVKHGFEFLNLAGIGDLSNFLYLFIFPYQKDDEE